MHLKIRIFGNRVILQKSPVFRDFKFCIFNLNETLSLCQKFAPLIFSYEFPNSFEIFEKLNFQKVFSDRSSVFDKVTGYDQNFSENN